MYKRRIDEFGGGILKSYHIVKCDGAVGKYYLVEDEQCIPIQKFYDESIAKKVCDELNMRELLKEEKEEVFP